MLPPSTNRARQCASDPATNTPVAAAQAVTQPSQSTPSAPARQKRSKATASATATSRPLQTPSTRASAPFDPQGHLFWIPGRKAWRGDATTDSPCSYGLLVRWLEIPSNWKLFQFHLGGGQSNQGKASADASAWMKALFGPVERTSEAIQGKLNEMYGEWKEAERYENDTGNGDSPQLNSGALDVMRQTIIAERGMAAFQHSAAITCINQILPLNPSHYLLNLDEPPAPPSPSPVPTTAGNAPRAAPFIDGNSQAPQASQQEDVVEEDQRPSISDRAKGGGGASRGDRLLVNQVEKWMEEEVKKDVEKQKAKEKHNQTMAGLARKKLAIKAREARASVTLGWEGGTWRWEA